MFTGLSLLRKQEKKTVEETEEQKKLQAYLSKYTSGSNEGGDKKKRKKKKPGTEGAAKAVAASGIRILDEDRTGFVIGREPQQQRVRDSFLDDEQDDDDDAPVVVNPGEAALAQRLIEKERMGLEAQGWNSVDRDGNGNGAGPSARGAPAADSSLPGGRRQRHDSPDASLPRRRSSPDVSPPRRRARHDSPDDTSPPRRQRHDSPNASPPRRQRHDSPEDTSPPRRQQHDSPEDTSPARRPARRDSPDDASPPRKPQHQHASGTAAAANGRGASAQASGRPAADKDASPPRRRRGQEEPPDASPPRKPEGRAEASGEMKRAARMMSDGTSAGMITGQQLMAEMERKRKAEKERYAKLDASVTGRNAETVYRDRKSGKRVDAEELAALEQAEKKPKSETPVWGGGIAQIREREARAEEMRQEAAKPFARSADDADIDRAFRDRVRFGDPMAHLAARRAGNAPPPPVVPQHMQRQMRKSGFVVPQEVPPHSWLNRRIGPPINRYNIRPGRHWDGVDRGNGFEASMFATKNELASRSDEAYMWAQADM